MSFPSAEELAVGAKTIVEAGILEKYDVKEIYGAHDEPFLDKGCFGFKVGHLQAASDNFMVTVKGVGTHGGRPHKGVDPIPAVVELYSAFQTIVSRRVDPMQSAVLSVCSVNAGKPERNNIVPAEATMSGTVRTFDPAVRDLVEKNMLDMAEGVAKVFGVECELKYTRLISALNNDKTCTEAGIAEAVKLVGEDNVVKDMTPFMSSEDFSCYQEKIPGSIMRIGVRDANHTCSIHNPMFDFNDEVLPLASTLFVNIAMARLTALAE